MSDLSIALHRACWPLAVKRNWSQKGFLAAVRKTRVSSTRCKLMVCGLLSMLHAQGLNEPSHKLYREALSLANRTEPANWTRATLELATTAASAPTACGWR